MKKFALLHKLKFLLLVSIDLSKVKTVVAVVDITELSPNHRTRIRIDTINSLEILFLSSDSMRTAVLLGDAVNFSKNNGTLHIFSGGEDGKLFSISPEQGTKIYRKTSNFFSSSLLSQKCKSRSRTKFPKL
nr:hypothetical protein MarQu_383 [Marseillevirus sp.]